jgi:tripartite-type tricarboxylate transporter receptor subunit TctC
MGIIRRSFGFLAMCAALLSAGAADAQTYPTRPIRLIVGFSAGGPTDVIARLVAQDMSATLGQSVVVENKTGANALIATELVAQSEADGYTLLFASLSHIVNHLIAPNAKYHPLKDFAPISNGALLPMLVVTGADSPFNTIQDLVAAAKAKPGELLYGSAGNGGSAHLAAAMLERATGTKMNHVPFRGNAPALNEVIAGRVTFMFYPVIGIADYVAGKKLKILAAGTRERSADFPNVPTMAESGLQGFEDTAPWVGMLAPASTPPAVVEKLSDAMRQSLAKPETKARVRALGGIPVGDTPAQFRAFLEKDMERWDRVIKASGIKAQ